MIIRAQANQPKVGAAAALDFPYSATPTALPWSNNGDLQETGEWRRNLDLKVSRDSPLPSGVFQIVICMAWKRIDVWQFSR